MKKCLITAINGFTGKYTSEIFEKQGYDIYGTILNQRKSQDLKNIYELDLMDAEEVKHIISKIRPDIVIHLAGLSYTFDSRISPYYGVHIVGTCNLLEAIATECPLVERILLASSSQVYARQNSVISESSNIKLVNAYGLSKYAMENMAELMMDKLPIIIVRPFNYTGIDQHKKFIIPKIVNAFIEKNTNISMGNTYMYRDFSDVRFIAKAYFDLAQYGQIGEIYNLCSNIGTSLDEVFSLLTEISGHEINIITNPEFVRINEQESIVGNNEKLSSIMPNPIIIDLKSTLGWMYHETKA